jgi:hypothetical protein
MAERYESKELIAAGEVGKYFPKNISELVGTGTNISFFGLMYKGGYKEGSVPVAKSRSLYLAVTYDTRLEHPHILDRCDMRDSPKKWIWKESHDFLDLKVKYEELDHQNPLLIIWLSSHLIKEDKDFVFTEFLRYADHEQLRGSGIATQVFESICEKSRADNLKYIYVDDRSNGWPSQSRLMGVGWLPKEMFDEISSTYYDKPRDEVFNVPMSRNLVRVLDDAVHERLYQQLLEQREVMR